MRTWVIYVAGLVVAVLTVSALHAVVPTAVSSALYVVLVVGAGLGARAVSTHRRRVTRADQPGSVEHEHALRAAAGTLPVSLLSLLALAAWLVVNDLNGPAGLAYAAAAVVVVAYWIGYARLRRGL